MWIATPIGFFYSYILKRSMMAYYRLGTLTALSSRRHLQVVHGVENNFMFLKEYNKSNTKNFL